MSPRFRARSSFHLLEADFRRDFPCEGAVRDRPTRPIRVRGASHFLALLLAAGFWPPGALAELTDSAVHLPPDYSQVLPPEPGVFFTDPVFGTTVRRLSNAPYTLNAFTGDSVLQWVMQEYATVSAFNLDASRMILQHQGYLALYTGEGDYVEDLPFTLMDGDVIHTGVEPRWSRTDPDLLYYIEANTGPRTNRLKVYDVEAGASTLLHEFTEYDSISGHGESDVELSSDGHDLLVLAGVLAGTSNREIFVYDAVTNTKGGATLAGPAGTTPFDSLYLTPDDNVTVTWIESGTGRFQGIELFDRDMSFLRQVTTTGGHMDVTRDGNGDEVLVWANANDGATPCGNGVVKVRLSDAAHSCLPTLDPTFEQALHVSCPDDSGFCVVGLYAPFDPEPTEDEWRAYTNELVEVDLDGGEVRRIVHHRSRPFGANTFNYQPRASVSPDGRRLVFASNFAIQELMNVSVQYADAFHIELDGIFLDGFETGDAGRWLGADGFVREIPIFTDDFETGGTFRWSSSSP